MELSIREGNEMLLDVQVESGAFAFIKSAGCGEQFKEHADMSAQEKNAYREIEGIMQKTLAQVQQVVMALPHY